MNDNKEELIKCLGSEECAVRLLAWDKLFGLFYGAFYKFFLYGNKNIKGSHDPQDATNLVHQVYEKARERLRRRPLSGKNPEGYIWKMAHNLLKDHWRYFRQQQRRYIPIEEDLHDLDWKSVEEASEEELEFTEKMLGIDEDSQKVIELSLRLCNLQDHLLIMMLSAGNCTAYQASCLMPISKSGVHRHFKKSIGEIRKQWERADEYLAIPSPWEERLIYSGDRSTFGVNCLNNSIKNLASDSQEELCKLLGLNTFDQFNEIYFSSLVFRDAKTPEVKPRVCLLPRKCVNWGILEGKSIDYVDFEPVFLPTKVSGRRQELLYLRDKKEYSAWVTEKHYEQNVLKGTDWHFHHPDGLFTLYKPYDPSLPYFYSNPQSQEKALLIFQIYSGERNQLK